MSQGVECYSCLPKTAWPPTSSAAQAHSAPNSAAIVGSSDLVHEYSGVNAGQYTYRAWQYVPSTMTGLSYFILLNQYDDAGTNNNWSVQVSFDGDTNTVTNEGASAGTLPKSDRSHVVL